LSIRIVRLGSPRASREGLRIGTVRHPPRGVPKGELAARDFYDVWLPELAPSAELVRRAKGAGSERDWQSFAKRYRREMAAPERGRLLDLLAALSQHTDFSVGCYCADEARCHRSQLRTLLEEHGALLGDVPGDSAVRPAGAQIAESPGTSPVSGARARRRSGRRGRR
jgi:uncharacterized protein YeaO (DUF488 family)